MRVPQWIKPGVWGAVIGAVAMMIIGFAWWGWTLSSTAEHMATERANAAVVALFTPTLCGKVHEATRRYGETDRVPANSFMETNGVCRKGRVGHCVRKHHAALGGGEGVCGPARENQNLGAQFLAVCSEGKARLQYHSMGYPSRGPTTATETSEGNVW